MSGKGELVEYTRLFKKKPTPKDKAELKEKINAIIDQASTAITIEAMVEASVDSLEKELKKKDQKKG